MNAQNQLGKEKSPYLLQHRDNPVNWYAWGEAAFAAARTEGKPIFLSIGYSTCYWCHMMEKDSFERTEVAEVLNRHFIPIKVDREERPDVDRLYMNAVVGMTGHGGWPLSVFLTPDLKPFFGGTFFWRDPFIALLSQLGHLWTTERDKIDRAGTELIAHLARQDTPATDGAVTPDLLLRAFYEYRDRFDSEWGGFGNAPKFPPSMTLTALLRIHRRSERPDVLFAIEKTLTAMAEGGLYDAVGGGFHRYATDRAWRVPHFEKMLYDNALLATAYLEAYQVTHKPAYREVTEETLKYLLRDMRAPEGGFWSAEDAGEVGKEGEFYTWSWTELESLLPRSQLKALQDLYAIKPAGNFEHGQNILYLASDRSWEDKEALREVKKILFEARAKRPRPHRDDKILSAWNGLAIAAFAKAYQVLREPRYLKAAEEAAAFILDALFQGDTLLARYCGGESAIPATSTDYAYLIHGLLSLYEASFNPEWFRSAEQLQDLQNLNFWDEATHAYFLSDPRASGLPLRQRDFSDSATPSGNAVSALNLLKLFCWTGALTTKTRADALLKTLAAEAKRYPSLYAQALTAFDFALDPASQIAIVGNPRDPGFETAIAALSLPFLPNKVLAASSGPSANPIEPPLLSNKTPLPGQTVLYVCRDPSCQEPTTDIKIALAEASKFSKLS